MTALTHQDEQANAAAVKNTAREWFVRLTLEQPTRTEREAFEAWRAEHPSHEAVYRRFEQIWEDSGELQELADLVPLEADRSSVAVRIVRAVRDSVAPPLVLRAAAVLGVVALAIVLLRTDVLEGFMPSSRSYATETAEVREIRLPDGSTVTLGARSAIELAFYEAERRVVLSQGEAFFDVRKDPSRPFIVAAGDKQVRAVGTQFEVHRGEDELRVAVVEGIVEVSHAAAIAGPELDQVPEANSSVATLPKRRLVAGQQLVTRGAGSIDPQFDVQRAVDPGGWRSGRLVYVDAPLREVIADANRYSEQRIEVAAEVGELLVSVTYQAYQVNEMIGGLSRTLPIEVSQSGPDRLVLKPAPAPR